MEKQQEKEKTVQNQAKVEEVQFYLFTLKNKTIKKRFLCFNLVPSRIDVFIIITLNKRADK